MANRAEPRRTVDRLAATWLHVAMTRVKIAEGGREIEVMDRDRPIARIAPIPKDAPRIHVVPARRRLTAADAKPLPSAGWPAGSLGLLLEERRDR